MVDMAMDMVLVMDMVDMDMDTMDTMARDPLMLSQDMATMDMDMVMVMDMVDMVMDIMDTTERDLLMLSQDMDTMAMDMAMVMVMDTVMDMAMDTTDKKHQSFMLCRIEFSEQTKNEVAPQGTSHYHSKIMNKLFFKLKK